ncbi:MAG: hypothetical protein HUJ66_04230 [Oscillospiraceae bacterium]|nr:hypothetical protein [Oscillospiraceae bacterium]
MFIKYELANGLKVDVEVTEEVAAYIEESDRLMSNAERRHSDHRAFSMDALVYEGPEVAYHVTPETVCILREEADHIKDWTKQLSETQRRRLMMKMYGLSFREIAAVEGTSPNAIVDSINSARKIFLKNY